MLLAMTFPPVSLTKRCTWFVVLGVEALLAVIAGCFLYAEQLNACMLGGVILVVAATLLLRLS
jgi:multidrug transporter EmrE-like cation transporter